MALGCTGCGKSTILTALLNGSESLNFVKFDKKKRVIDVKN